MYRGALAANQNKVFGVISDQISTILGMHLAVAGRATCTRPVSTSSIRPGVAARACAPTSNQSVLPSAPKRFMAKESRRVRAGADGLQKRERRGSGSMLPMSPFDLLTMDLVDPLMEGMFRTPSNLQRTGMRNMPIDILEESDAFELKADLPGVMKEDIKIDVDGDTLSVSVTHTETREEGDPEGEENGNEAEVVSERKVHRRERSSMYLERSVRLPDTADMEQVDAKLQDGVLTLRVPKKEHAIARRRTITVQ